MVGIILKAEEKSVGGAHPVCPYHEHREGYQMRKIWIVGLVLLLLSLCACSSPAVGAPIPPEVPSPSIEEMSPTPTPTPVPTPDVISLACEDMSPWQAQAFQEACTESSATLGVKGDVLAQYYLDSKGLMQHWSEEVHIQPQKISDLSEQHKALLDRIHEYIHRWAVRRDNMLLVARQKHQDMNYSIVAFGETDGESALTLVKSDETDEVIDYISGKTPMSSGFHANIINWPEVTAVFGVMNKTRLGGENFDERLPNDFKAIEVVTTAGEVVRQKIEDPNGVLLFLAAGAEVERVRMLDAEGHVAEESAIDFCSVREA